jgi:hypothetical protein
VECEQAGCLCSRRWPAHAASGVQPRELVPSWGSPVRHHGGPAALAGEADRLDIASYARRRPALPEGLEWRVEGLVAAGRTVDVSRAGASWAPNRLDVFVGAATTRFTGDSPTLGCDHLQQHIELQSVICSALLHSLDPVVGGLCMHILWLSLE